MRYQIQQTLLPVKETASIESSLFVEVLSKEDYHRKYPNLVRGHLLMRSIGNIHSSKADIFKDYILGTLCIPNKSSPAEHDQGIGFYLDENKLLFIGDVRFIDRLLQKAAKEPIMDITTPAQALFEFLDQLILSDASVIDRYEQQLENHEETMLEDVNEIPKDFESFILKNRKNLLHLNHYYKQLAELGQSLTDCPNQIIDQDARIRYRFFTDKAERLCTNTQNLREYTLQLRDMYQARIDVRQNKVMQLLTVVTTIFTPLTLLTGWYGMNFQNMPELKFAFGYPLMILAALLLVILGWIFFRKKKWF